MVLSGRCQDRLCESSGSWSSHLWRKITSICADFLVERTGFEPLTHRSAGTRALDDAAASASAFTASCGYPMRKRLRRGHALYRLTSDPATLDPGRRRSSWHRRKSCACKISARRHVFGPPFFASGWSTAVEMPPGRILQEHRLVAQKKTARGSPWTKEDVRELKGHSKARTHRYRRSQKKTKRTERALRRKAGILGIGLGHRR